MLALRKKTLGQFFPSFACFAHKKLSAESRPSAESWLVAKTDTFSRQYIYIFRFRSYLVTDVGRILDAKGGCMNFREA